MNTSRLKEILEARLEEIAGKLWEDLRPADFDHKFSIRLDEAWAEYLNGIDCIILEEDDIRDDFESIFNESSQGRVCVTIDHPTQDADNKQYILMSRELAEKSMVLDGLPESWFPESSPTQG